MLTLKLLVLVLTGAVMFLGLVAWVKAGEVRHLEVFLRREQRLHNRLKTMAAGGTPREMPGAWTAAERAADAELERKLLLQRLRNRVKAAAERASATVILPRHARTWTPPFLTRHPNPDPAVDVTVTPEPVGAVNGRPVKP